MATLSLFDIVFPKRCVACKTIGTYLCPDCFRTIKQVQTLLCVICYRPAIDGKVHPVCKTRYTPEGVSAAYIFDTPIKQLIHVLKYRGVTDVAKLSAELLRIAVPQTIPKDTIIMPVPLYVSKKRERGFNQSEKLSLYLGHTLQLSVDTKSLIRTKATRSQTTLHREERKANVQNVFQCLGNVRDKHILLVDDTVTTGATLVACANALKRAGATTVWGVALAQAPLRT